MLCDVAWALLAAARKCVRTAPSALAASLFATTLLLIACQAPPLPAVNPAPAPTETTAPLAAVARATARSDATVAPTATVEPTATSTAEPAPTTPPEPTATVTPPEPTATPATDQAAPFLQVAPQVTRSLGAARAGRMDARAGMRLRIPRIGVNAPIVEVGLLENGEMAAPKDGEEVVWYGGSPIPGRAGNALLAGHLDWQRRGAVFWRLRELRPGDRVFVDALDGSDVEFTVTSSDLYPTAEAPVAEVVASGPEPIITMITCEGTFNQATRDYSHRRVVRATLSAWLQER